MAGNRNLNSAKTARKDEFYTQLTDIEKEMRYGHTSKMFFEVNQTVNFRVIIGGNHIETCRKSFKISRCEWLVRIKWLATKRLQNS